jgi:hypothetical protein
MPNHKPGAFYTLSQIRKAYHADESEKDAPRFLLHSGSDILALCLDYRSNPLPHEVWVPCYGTNPDWGAALAALKGEKSLPVYYRQRGRALFEYRDHHVITGETQDRREIAKRFRPARSGIFLLFEPSIRVARIVFITRIKRPTFW